MLLGAKHGFLPRLSAIVAYKGHEAIIIHPLSSRELSGEIFS